MWNPSNGPYSDGLGGNGQGENLVPKKDPSEGVGENPLLPTPPDQTVTLTGGMYNYWF